MFDWLRTLRRLLWRSYLFSLPIQLPFILTGSFEAISFSNDQERVFDASLEHFKENVASAQHMDWFSVPGAPSIHEFKAAPFYVAQLRDPTNWWTYLGLTRFDISKDDRDTPVNVFAGLDTLYRRSHKSQSTRPWHHWIYLSDKSLHLEGLLFDDWDEAFYDLVQYHYVHPAVANSEFHYISCPFNFLCDIWRTRGPALVHFTTETVEDPQALDEKKPHVHGYVPVTARIIEFPTTNPRELLLPPGIFPSMFNQLRGVTENPDVWKVHVPHDEGMQWVIRLEDAVAEYKKKYSESYGRLKSLESTIKNIVGSDSTLSVVLELVSGVTFLTTTMIHQGIYMARNTVKSIAATFLGKSDAKVDEDNADDLPQVEDNFMAQMLRGFMDSAGKEIGQDVEELAKSSPEGEEALKNMWDIVRRKPKQEEEEAEGLA